MNQHIPPPIAEAFAGRAMIPMKDAARLLSMDAGTLKEHIQAGHISYVVKGVGAKHVRRMFTITDILSFIERMRQRECPSTSPKTRRSSSTTSNGGVIAFTDLLARRNGGKLRPSSGASARS